MKKKMKSLLPTSIVTKIAYVGNKLSISFCVKDVTKVKHNHDIMQLDRYPETGCNDQYLGETDRRISEKVFHYVVRDPNFRHFDNFV